MVSKYSFNQFCRFSFSWFCSLITRRSTFLAAPAILLLKGSFSWANSFVIRSIKFLFSETLATSLSRVSACCCSCFKGARKASQAAFLPLRTCFLMSFSMATNSCGVATLVSSIQARIFTLQSKAASQSKRSLFLYLS